MKKIILAVLIIACARKEETVLKIGENRYTTLDLKLADSVWSEFLLNRLLANLGMRKDVHLLPPLVEEIPKQERSLIIKKYYEKMVKEKTPLTDADFRKALDEISLRVHLVQLNFETRKQADYAYMMIKKGVPFDTVVLLFRNPKFFSGDIGYVPYHFLSDETRAMIKRMKVGEISPPYRESYHWKIIQLVDKRKEELKNIERIKDVIRTGLKERKERLYLKRMVEELKKKHHVVYNESILPYLFKPYDSIPPIILNTWLVRMDDRELKLGSIHRDLYQLRSRMGYHPEDVLNYEIQNELLYQEALRAGFKEKFWRELRLAREDLIAKHMYKLLITDSINISAAEIDSIISKEGIKNRIQAERLLRESKEKARRKKIMIRLKTELAASLNVAVLNRLGMKEE
ncbi:hypothetical protein DRP53_10055 [candidate division WOR-3 bacterium]|uniref:PpiC domain-containing protein n=1 Tax=candidate division WOR-3 bacterium TaxID=2052148 RepID=A0A660SD62_UNCW3|nr:MAG: hypothetical protein DRP53_10055 [candidate division WOR-3 bacterium]